MPRQVYWQIVTLPQRTLFASIFATMVPRLFIHASRGGVLSCCQALLAAVTRGACCPLHVASNAAAVPSTSCFELSLIKDSRRPTCFWMPSVMSICERMQLTHMFEGLGAMLVPQRQHSLRMRVCVCA